MTTIKDQIALEKRMIAYGVHRYNKTVASAEEGGRAADTAHAQRLIQSFLEPVANGIDAFCAENVAVRSGKYRVLLRLVDSYKAAYFGIRCVLNHFTKEEPLASLGLRIGTMIEDELKFTEFKKMYGKYYDAIIRDFKNKGTKSYRHMHRVLTLKANEYNVEWNSWSTADKVAVGIKVIDIILETTDMIEKTVGAKKQRGKKRPPAIIKPTAACLEWVKRFNHYAEMLNPDRVPCVIPPDPWTQVDQGGFYSPQLRSRTPLVKTKNKQHTDILMKADLTTVMQAVNALQETEWEINEDVFNVLTTAWNQSLTVGLPRSEPYEIPVCPLNKEKKDFTKAEREQFDAWKAEARMVHTMERDRVSKCFQVIRILRLAREFREFPSFWYVWQCDFRGRVYSTVTGLSPQGPDFGKALIRFKHGKPLGEQGAMWFKIHGANCYGEDKLPYKDRIAWVEENSEHILRAAEDPISYKDFWGAADKPYQFLAFCFEYRGYTEQGNDFVSHLPVALDGSCNGLQNFSALLRDEVGGSATNLLPTNSPVDIYAEVASVLTEKVRRSTTLQEREQWLTHAKENMGKLPRGLTKRPVMTLPYGSTRQSCREYIYKYLVEDAPNLFDKDMRFKASVALTPLLWGSIGEVVIAARKGMDWIQECASALAKENKGITWTVPSGFVVFQNRKKTKSRQVHTELAGHFRLRLDEDTKRTDVMKQKLGAAPNFVHSLDACHLMLTINRAREQGITSFACIHDDYGTHAADTPKLHKCIREAFVDLYKNNDPIQDLIKANASVALPEPPPRGTLDIEQVLKAAYFFG